MKSARFLVRGFTLIELLVVIAVLAVIAAGVVVGINPAKRINQANDTKIRNDIGQIATALQAYFTTNGFYPGATEGDLNALAPGDLKSIPLPPGGGAYTYSTNPVQCTATSTSCEAAVSFALKDPKLGTGALWCWKSSTGTAIEVTATAGCSP